MPSDPHLKKWMLFVDGENFTIRGQQFASDNSLSLPSCDHYERDVFLWVPNSPPLDNILRGNRANLQNHGIRAYYYTSASGDDNKLQSTCESLWSIGFQPMVFKRDAKAKRSKGVDIALAKDFLCNAFYGNYDAAVLIAGDGDYVPMVEEVKRLGKVVCIVFFSNAGLSPRLRLAADQFAEVDDFFLQRWKQHLATPPVATSA